MRSILKSESFDRRGQGEKLYCIIAGSAVSSSTSPIKSMDKRHLQVFCENIAAILQAQSACLSNWLPYLSHRDCEARSHMERLNYFLHNPKINAETFYYPLVEQFLKAWEGMEMTLVLDTSTESYLGVRTLCVLTSI